MSVSGVHQYDSTSSTSSTSSSSNSSSSSSSSAAGMDTTFLSLLTTELQNQDPTQPMDSGQMVGQMISLNQLEQLISIKAILQGQSTTSTDGTSSSSSSSSSNG